MTNHPVSLQGNRGQRLVPVNRFVQTRDSSIPRPWALFAQVLEILTFAVWPEGQCVRCYEISYQVMNSLLSLRYAVCDALNMRGKLLVGAILAVWGVQMAVAQSQSGCALADGLSSLIASKYPKAHVVRLSDLNQDDKTLFQKEHGSSCPGLTHRDFYGDGKPTFALVLLRANGSHKAELVVCSSGPRSMASPPRGHCGRINRASLMD
jgi:hypothetical protein